MLHITNGESVHIQETGLPGDVIYWMDALHEGPVPPAVQIGRRRVGKECRL